MDAIRSVGVVGAGTMGLGIAQVCATAGFVTRLFDVNSHQVERAVRTIGENLAAAVAKNKLSEEEKSAVLKRIHPAHSLDELNVDLIIEAAVEKLDIKQDLFRKLEEITNGKSILATNTSSISVTQIGSVLKDPTRCIGLHFFNPADRMKLVEIISGRYTSSEVVDYIRQFSRTIGKNAVLAKDSPGFIVNRVARHFYVESLLLLGNQVATVGEIDALMRSTGFRMGPFELMDLIGVDTNLSVTTLVYEGFNRANKFAPNPIQQQLVKEGKLGKKTGNGFYVYETR